MASLPFDHVTLLLAHLNEGDPTAADELVPLVYGELRDIAKRCLGTTRATTLQPTVLVHEAFLRLFGPAAARAANRREFFGLSAKIMRDVLVDEVRRRGAEKRGGGRRRLTLTGHVPPAEDDAFDLLDLDDALRELAEVDPRQHRIVELRVFGGLEIGEIAAIAGVSKSTVEREWRAARAWLGVRLGNPEP